MLGKYVCPSSLMLPSQSQCDGGALETRKLCCPPIKKKTTKKQRFAG